MQIHLSCPQASVIIRTGNLLSLKLIVNPLHHDLTKHIKTQYHYTREMVATGEVRFKFVATARMVIDNLTKEVSRTKTRYCSQHMGLTPRKGFEIIRLVQHLCCACQAS